MSRNTQQANSYCIIQAITEDNGSGSMCIYTEYIIVD